MRVALPIPSTDFDPTETAVPWHELTAHGVEVVFSTPDGKPGRADDRMVSGSGLGPWKPVLQAAGRAKELYREMERSAAFANPRPWAELVADDFDGLLLPGGHAVGMRPYLESQDLQQLAADFMARDAPVGAICHGVVVLARTTTKDGRPVLDGRRVTALLRSQEMLAYGMTFAWLGRYYRTYEQTVEEEVRAALGDRGHFDVGPLAVLRDDPGHLERGFVVRDRNLITARWPGDAHRFAAEFEKCLVASASA